MSVSYPADGNAVCFQLEDESFWFKHRNRCILEAVRQFGPAGRIVDVGGGNGFVARALIDAGYKTTVLEPGEEGAENARRFRKIPDVICGTLDGAGLAPESVPAAGLFDVLEHIEDDGAFLATLRAVLVPGGVVYLTVPALQWLWSITDVEAGHFRRYSTSDLRRTFERAGFEVLYVTYFFEILLVPFFLLRTLPYKLGLGKPRDASDYHGEHTAGGGMISAILARLLARETGAIAERRTMWTGTSCLVVARKARTS
jgi:SAM-dependent methyltransferase